MRKRFIVALALALTLASTVAFAEGEKASVPDSIPMHSRENLKSWGFFYTGGEYEMSESNKGSILRGQMYVEVFEPVNVTKEYPLVMMHGNYQTGLNWMGTIEGTDGWVDYFLNEGYIVYVVDAPTRGRASYPLEPNTATRNVTGERALSSFAGIDNEKQTQWPGEKDLNDPLFKGFFSTQNVSIASNAEMQRLVRDAGVELLDRIGEAILITHSQSGPYGWLLADARPELVKGIVALEPAGPTFSKGTTDYGIAALPLTYEPAISSAEELETEEYVPEDSSLDTGLLQKEPARQLVNLKNIPIAIVTSEASYHNSYDYLLSLYLKQAGVENEHLYLADAGILGNAHMMMIEHNSLEIAAFVNQWMANNILSK